MNNYVQAGETLTLTAPTGGVVAGTGYKIGGLFVVAVADVAQTLPFEGKRTGVFTLPKVDGGSSAWTEGVALYWDASAGKATKVAGENMQIGFAAAAAGDSATTGSVLLTGGGGSSALAGLSSSFASTEQTGTGSSQNVAHGLGVAPTLVIVTVTEHPGTPDTGAFDIAEGTHTTTNVVVTVTTGVKFKVYAWA